MSGQGMAEAANEACRELWARGTPRFVSAKGSVQYGPIPVRQDVVIRHKQALDKN